MTTMVLASNFIKEILLDQAIIYRVVKIGTYLLVNIKIMFHRAPIITELRPEDSRTMLRRVSMLNHISRGIKSQRDTQYRRICEHLMASQKNGPFSSQRLSDRRKPVDFQKKRISSDCRSVFKAKRLKLLAADYCFRPQCHKSSKLFDNYLEGPRLSSISCCRS